MSQLWVSSILLVVALSIDAFVASFAYGAEQIHIPFHSTAVIGLTCSGVLAVAMLAGNLMQRIIPAPVTTGICFAILFLLGFFKLFDSLLKSYLRKSESGKRDLRFKLFDFHFMLSVYADSTQADFDRSRCLSPTEAFYLAVALSLDGLAAGFGSGIAASHWMKVALLSFLVNIAAVMAGCWCGRKVLGGKAFNLSWLGGAILLIVAFSKLF